MKLKIRYENEFQTVELDEKATQDLWVSLSIDSDDDMPQEEREKFIQEVWDEQYNKPEYNIWHRETRHIDPTPKRKRMDGRRGYICGEVDDDSFNIMDYLAVTDADYETDDKAETREKYERVCRLIHETLKPDFAEIFISIASKRTTPKQIAKKNVNTEGLAADEVEKLITKEANKISKKYRRALEKIKQVL